MPLSVKIQPIDFREESTEPLVPAPRPVVKSRLRRLFRISTGGGGGDELAAAPASDQCFEPSSVCLAKMVQNFIEESNNDKQSVKCGRTRCNCFNGSNGSDSSDAEPDGHDAADFLKSLVVCASVNERNVLAHTVKIVERNGKACKRKDDLRKAVVEALTGLGYDGSICKSKWEKSPSLPAGEYEYVDVIVGGGERLIVDVDFRSEFEIAKSTKSYKLVLQTLPSVFVGEPDRLKKIIAVASEAMRQSLKKKGMHFPPWRKAEYFEAKWLSPYARLHPQLMASPATPLVARVVESVVLEMDLTKSAPENREEDKEEGKAGIIFPSPAQQGDSNNALFAMSCEGEDEDEDEANLEI